MGLGCVCQNDINDDDNTGNEDVAVGHDGGGDDISGGNDDVRQMNYGSTKTTTIVLPLTMMAVDNHDI